MRRVGFVALALALGAAGCGGGSDSSTSSAASTTAGAPPADLLGTYAMTLKPSDVPASKPPELTDPSSHWLLKITKTGGVDNGPTLTLVSSLGVLESSSLTVSGDNILLHDEECGSGGLVQSEYAFSLQGSTLTFKTVKNGCSDGVAEALLTSEPWQKQAK